MTRYGILVVALGVLVLALGCPRGPEKPAQPGVDTGQGQTAPQVPEGPPASTSQDQPSTDTPGSTTPSGATTPTEDFPTIPEPTTGQPAIGQSSGG